MAAQKRTAPRKAKKRVKTGKSKGPNKKRAPKLAQDERKEAPAVPEQGQNVPNETGNVPEKSEYRQLLSLLPTKRARFVEEYLIDLDTTNAAKRAGYSAHTAMKQGVRLLHFVSVKAAIAAGKAEISKRIEISQDAVVRELALIGFSNMSDFIIIDEGGGVQAIPLDQLAEGKSRIVRKVKEKRIIRTVQGTKDKPDGEQILEATYEFELYDKVKSLELLAKHLGMLSDTVNLNIVRPHVSLEND